MVIEDPDQTVRFRIGQRFNEGSLHHAEDGCVGSDSQGQGQNSHSCQDGAPEKLAYGESEVAQKTITH